MEVHGRIVTPGGVRVGTVRFGARVEAVVNDPAPPPDPTGLPWLVPGFVDAHVHGGAGGDTMEGEEALRAAARFHGASGTTTLVATTLTAPFDRLEAALVGVRGLVERPERGGAVVAGAHLEGPWISPRRLGAQPAHARPPEVWEVERLLEIAPVRVVTLAPEIDGGLDLVERLAAQGVRVQIGHSAADAGTVWAAFDRGAAGFTHLFNAMGSFHHRRPGVLGVALASGAPAELILDGEHVGDEAFAMARSCVPHWYCVSDAIAAAGLPDGSHRLAGLELEIANGVSRLPDGTLAGSTTTLHGVLLRLVQEHGFTMEAAVERLAAIPARMVGLTDRGRIEPGARADLLQLDPRLRLERIWIGGDERTPLPAS